jgi:hypothetical protein
VDNICEHGMDLYWCKDCQVNPWLDQITVQVENGRTIKLMRDAEGISVEGWGQSPISLEAAERAAHELLRLTDRGRTEMDCEIAELLREGSGQ